jgi:hypothetical protein
MVPARTSVYVAAHGVIDRLGTETQTSKERKGVYLTAKLRGVLTVPSA